jgi:hypothetical protein
MERCLQKCAAGETPTLWLPGDIDRHASSAVRQLATLTPSSASIR